MAAVQARERERWSWLVGGVNGWACSLSVFEVFNIEAANPEPKMIEARVRSLSLPLPLSLLGYLKGKRARRELKMWKVISSNYGK